MLEKGVWLVFRLYHQADEHPQYWGLAGDCIREIIHRPRVYPIPRVPDIITGCLWYRGQIYTVISAGRTILGDLWKKPSSINYYVAILNIPEAPIALDVGMWLNMATEDEWLPLEYNREIPTLASGTVGWFIDDRRVPVFLLEPERLVAEIDHITLQFTREVLATPILRSNRAD